MSRGIGHFSASLNLFTGVAESHVKRRDGRFCYVEKERERERGGGKKKKYRACLGSPPPPPTGCKSARYIEMKGGEGQQKM